MTVTDITNITTGLTNRVEICVINNICTYNFSINRSYVPRCVEKPKLPPLIITEAGISKNGLCEQTKSNRKQNVYEIIPHNRYKYVKELLGYVGLHTNDYDLYRVVEKDTEIGVNYIDCGSSTTTDIGNGIYYTKDTGTGGSTHKVYNNIIDAGALESIYQTSRSGSSLNWKISAENVMHKVLLRFADFWPGINRKLNVTINDHLRIKNLSINKTIGGTFKRFDLGFRVPVTDNLIDITITGNGQLNAIDVYRLDKGDVEFTETSRDAEISNKDTYLFLNKNINILESNLKKKFLDIRKNILPSRDMFFY